MECQKSIDNFFRRIGKETIEKFYLPEGVIKVEFWERYRQKDCPRNFTIQPVQLKGGDNNFPPGPKEIRPSFVEKLSTAHREDIRVYSVPKRSQIAPKIPKRSQKILFDPGDMLIKKNVT